MTTPASHPTLFELPPVTLDAAPPRPEQVRLAARWPESVRLGTMSWSYPAWQNLLYGAKYSAKVLADRGLTAYARHPLLRGAEIDRSYYEPLSAEVYRGYAAQVPAGFRFLVKAHEDCIVHRYPAHARYGRKAGERNPLYLDPGYTADRVIAPLAEGLGASTFALLFQFPPQELDERPQEFADRIHRFLAALPKVPFAYAVELRNAERFTTAYAEALVSGGGIHCHNVWSHVPPVLAQAKLLGPATRRPLLVRWLMRRGDTYDAASARGKPFGKLVLPDPDNLAAVARLVRAAHQHDVPSFVAIDNKAEGCAPETAFRLAAAVLDAPP